MEVMPCRVSLQTSGVHLQGPLNGITLHIITSAVPLQKISIQYISSAKPIHVIINCRIVPMVNYRGESLPEHYKYKCGIPIEVI